MAESRTQECEVQTTRKGAAEGLQVFVKYLYMDEDALPKVLSVEQCM